jgi:N-acylneuraminate cytidylyltransferase
VGGTPLVGRAVTCAREAELIDRVILSTDDPEIAAVGEEYGAEVPFLRPTELADDTAPMAGVVSHLIENLEEPRSEQVICVLLPTVPLRSPADVDAAVRRFMHSDATSLVTVNEYATPVQWACELEDTDRLRPACDEGPLWQDDEVRSQDLQGLVHPNGMVFASRIDGWVENESFYTDDTIAHMTPTVRSLDVDEPWQLDMVRAIHAHGLHKSKNG